MYHNRTRRRKFRTNDRPFRKRNGSESHRNNSPNSIPNGQIRSGHFRGHQNARQLIEKYSNLAKEASSAGDRILSENYLQHADHFMRVIEEKNKNKIISNSDYTKSSTSDNKVEKVEEENKKE
mgnify:CR=1 FL=1